MTKTKAEYTPASRLLISIFPLTSEEILTASRPLRRITFFNFGAFLPKDACVNLVDLVKSFPTPIPTSI